MSASTAITRVAIYPPLGIARVGNSPEFYLASETPGQAPPAAGGYKDGRGRIKKQAVRFRIYGFDAEGGVRELTADQNTTIEWRVHIANRKAAWYQFNNALDMAGLAVPAALRNGDIRDAARAGLIIAPRPRTITGANQSGTDYYFDDGEFLGKQVPLGEIRTDEKGRLHFLGGEGHSASKDDSLATTFANNDGWHDDVSDGIVRARVTIDGVSLEAEPAMVAVTPPNFGQGLFGVVTMYDVVLDLYLKSGWVQPPETLVFWEHIYPIVERVVQTQWVNHGFFMIFGQNSPSDFLAPEILSQLASPDPAHQAKRTAVFNWFRDPSSKVARPAHTPPFYGDAFNEYEGMPNDELPVTATQHDWLRRWAAGEFITGQPAPIVPFDQLDPKAQLKALERAPLEECLGGPFHPGIEITWPFRNLIMWQSAFRLKVLPEGTEPGDNYGPLLDTPIVLSAEGPLNGSGPGSLTRWLGVPWQTDEASCLSGYDPSLYLPLPSFWAARVPNQILSQESFQRIVDERLPLAQRLKHLDYRQDWLRDLGTQYQKKINKMIHQWHELGIVSAQPDPGAKDPALPSVYFVEKERIAFQREDPTLVMVEHSQGVEPGTKGPLKAPPGPKKPRPRFGRDER